jgi:Pyruvate/2-oxoacid:ferredoxin oxidoreductase delta subunit
MIEDKMDVMTEKGEGMTEYRKMVIYFFSGTGNSRNVASWISGVAEEKGLRCSLVDIARTDRREVEGPGPDSLIVFVSPVHGFNYPPVMVNFISRFPRGKNPVLLLNTRAGMLIGRWVTPGLSGIAFYLAALILKIKGYSIRAMFPVDLPSNWISLHPGLNDRTVKFLHEKNLRRVRAFAERALSGRSDFRALREMAQDLLISPAALLYYFVGRFFLAKTFYASRDCDNCGACIKGCAVKAIIEVNDRPFWTFSCESCMHCIGLCPKKAIEVGHGYFFAFIFLFYSGLMVLFYRYFESLLFPLENGFLRFVLEMTLGLFFLALWYRLVNLLMRFRFFERAVAYTSLTKYSFWGRRYRALKMK